MRIISQNRRINICYERVHLYIMPLYAQGMRAYGIRAYDCIKSDVHETLAIYSTLEKAQAVFESLYQSLKGQDKVAILPDDDKGDFNDFL